MVKLPKSARHDPNAPKKPLTAYFSYLNSKRAEIVASHPEWEGKDKVTGVSKTAGAMWKALSPEEKKPYTDNAASAKAKYDVLFNAYKETDNYAQFQEAKKIAIAKAKKKQLNIKDKNRPKKPLSAYFRFLAVFRKEHPDLKLTQHSKQGGAKWKTLSDEDKKQYTDAANEGKAAYEHTIAEYEAGPLHAAFLAEKEALKKKLSPKSSRKKQYSDTDEDETD